MPGLYFHHSSSHEHDTGGHPENAGRLRAIESALNERDWLGLERIEAPAATREQVLQVHRAEHVDAIEQLSSRGGGMLDLDTLGSAGSFNAAMHAAGGAVAAVDRLLDSDADPGFAFCGLRPPGHHAEAAQAMGFCLFNNVAVAAAHALAEHGAERVFVFDWDVHHGNGTEAIFYDTESVYYSSIHQSPLYPGTGAPGDRGSGAGKGYTLNLPVPPGSDGGVFLELLENEVIRAARQYSPRLVCISAGYDAHRDDPLAECMLETADFGEMASRIGSLASELEAPVLICLEGGYALAALSSSVVATLEALAGREP